MTENNIKVFEHPDFGIIRTIEEDGKVLFCASDVAKALGYAKPNNAVSAHCRYPVKRDAPHPQNPNKQIKMLFISEGDVYGLIIHSRLPSASQFENWVCNEIIPSIHSRGVYAVEELLNDPDFAIKTFKALKEERERVKALQTTVEELKPKASYYDVVLNCDGLISIGKIAKDYGKPAVWLNKLLCEQKIQFKQGGTWILYQKYADKGYTSSKTLIYHSEDGKEHSKVHTFWTSKGRLFIYDLLKSMGILPVAERNDDN